MKPEKSTSMNKSLGGLYRAKKTKPKSPILTGKLKLHRETFDAIEECDWADDDTITCNIAAWKNTDKRGVEYLTVQLSAPFHLHASERDGNDIFRSALLGDDE